MTTRVRPKSPFPNTAVHVTESAVDHVREFAVVEGKPGANLRVAVKGGGCSGLTYVLELVDEEAQEDEKVVDEHGLKVFIPKRSFVFLAGTTLEYSGGLNGKGFVFNNPNAKTTCGCGTSFSV